ncbi:MAG: hypothetical protein ACERKD_17715 [Prolixibacteraceae bacterium]
MLQKTEINIFVASSNELKEERVEFEKLVTQLNNQYRDYYHITLDIWEYSSEVISSERKQNDYNKLIIKSDIFIVLFHTKAGEYTVEEFNVAYKLFLESKKPQILVYFKNNKLESYDDSLIEFKIFLKKIGHFRSIFKDPSELIHKFSYQFELLHLADKLCNKFKKYYTGNLINDSFNTSLLSFNVLKYLVYNRLSYTNIWIGNSDIYYELQHMERLICRQLDEINERNWEKTNPRSYLFNNSNNKALFLVIESVDDYKELMLNTRKLKHIRNTILCFNFKSSALSKIYAMETYLQLNDKCVKVLTENKTESSNPLSLEDLVNYLNRSHLLNTKMGIRSKGFNDFLSFSKIDYEKLEINQLKNIFLNFILNFGEYEHKLEIIERVTNSCSIIYEALKTDLHLLTIFINNYLSIESFKTILEEKPERILFLTALNKINPLKTELYDLLVEKLPNEYFRKNYISGNVAIKPISKYEFWLLLHTHERLYSMLDIKNISPVIKYLNSIISPFNSSELSEIIEDPNMRFAYHLITEEENNRAYDHLSTMEENLYIYEI